MSIKQDLIDGEQQAALNRARMGAKAYDEWIKSQQAYLYSVFSSQDELKKILIKAGYDLIITNTTNYRYVKTHFGKGKWDYYFWFYQNGFLVANYNISDDINLIKKFKEKMEVSFGEKCFFESDYARNNYLKSKNKKSITTVVKPKVTEKKESEIEEVIEVVEPIPEYTFPTIFTDTSVLQQALKNVGIDAKMQGDNFEFTLDSFNTSIYKEGSSNYEFKIVGKCDLKKIHGYFSKVETEYNKVVQYNILQNIKNKVAKSSTMQLAQEEVLEDNSVLLTISI